MHELPQPIEICISLKEGFLGGGGYFYLDNVSLNSPTTTGNLVANDAIMLQIS